MLSFSLISSLCLTALSLKVSTCPRSLSLSARSLSRSKRHSDSSPPRSPHLGRQYRNSLHVSLVQSTRWAISDSKDIRIPNACGYLAEWVLCWAEGDRSLFSLSLWFSSRSSSISLLVWAMASHGSPGIDVDRGVQGTVVSLNLWGPDNAEWPMREPVTDPAESWCPGREAGVEWWLEMKWEGGIRFLWVFPEKRTVRCSEMSKKKQYPCKINIAILVMLSPMATLLNIEQHNNWSANKLCYAKEPINASIKLLN